mmetsp:Transcript_18203/g.52592  ORF Transcript_18203/g.52592 Transcript_18203/m.52592 type:complete len:178 (+) Transcript_18203:570-1103(+)
MCSHFGLGRFGLDNIISFGCSAAETAAHFRMLFFFGLLDLRCFLFDVQRTSKIMLEIERSGASLRLRGRRRDVAKFGFGVFLAFGRAIDVNPTLLGGVESKFLKAIDLFQKRHSFTRQTIFAEASRACMARIEQAASPVSFGSALHTSVMSATQEILCTGQTNTCKMERAGTTGTAN